MSTRCSAKSLHVTVISRNPKTVDRLQRYLNGAGVAAHCTQALHDVSVMPRAATAVVLFPDEFGPSHVLSAVASLRKARPKLLILLVTSTPQHFRPALAPDARSTPPVVLPKPAFGWTILDAIRARFDAEASQR